MNRYVIVCLIKGEALEFHEKIVQDVCSRFNVKRQRLPGHFTIKAPFETENIQQIEKFTDEFCSSHSKTPIKIENYGHFRNTVIYMDIKPSADAIQVHDRFIDLLKDIPWLEWKNNEGKGRVFHCTVVSKIKTDKFSIIWPYILGFPCCFNSSFDNISILKWEKDRWITHKEYSLST